MFSASFGERETMVAQEIVFVVTNLTCKVWACFSHAAGNSQTCAETGPFTIWISTEPLPELHILGDCS
jgi:hypothetical protein